MATATMTQTTETPPQSHENTTAGTLVHHSNQSQELIHHASQRRETGALSRQPRPQSAVVYQPPTHEDKPGEKREAQFLPWYTRWGYSISLGAAQGFLKPASLIRDMQDSIRSPLHQPNLLKTYRCRPKLPVRVFFPKPYDKEKPRQMPLCFTIHGGGFIMGAPQDNDAWNAKFASRYSATVVALNYNKAPKTTFPMSIHDVEVLILAVLSDSEIAPHIDRSRIAVGGWDAGGNLALTVTQLPAIRPIVTSVFAFYPPCDFTVTHHQKSRLRRYKAGVGGFRARETDYMLSMSPMIDWSYIPHGTDMRNPLLSQFFAEHDMLPRRVMIVGCELDMYAHEAWRTISKLAGREVPAMEQTVGREGQSDHGQMLFDDERFHFEQTYNDGSSYKWLLVPDTIHNFDQRIGGVVRELDFRADAEHKSEACLKEIGEWLLGPFHSAPTNGESHEHNGNTNGTTDAHRQIEQ